MSQLNAVVLLQGATYTAVIGAWASVGDAAQAEDREAVWANPEASFTTKRTESFYKVRIHIAKHL